MGENKSNPKQWYVKCKYQAKTKMYSHGKLYMAKNNLLLICH